MGKQCIIDHENENLAWSYCPSFGAAVAFTVFFGLITIAHIYQAYQHRKKFCWVIIMCCLWETAGFAMRSVSAKEIYGTWHYIPQELLIILSPIWLNAFVFMAMGRMIHFLIPEQKAFGVSARKLSLIFVLLDVLSFFIQTISSALMTSDENPTLARIGVNVYMGGVGAQELFIILFTFIAGRFQYKMNLLETMRGPFPVPWRRLLYVLYAALTCITIRIIFRLVEYSGGMYSSVATHEAYFYSLEAVPMTIALVIFNIVHPGLVLIGEDSEFQKKEKKSKGGKKTKGRKSRSRSHSRRRKGHADRDLESGSDMEGRDACGMQDMMRTDYRRI